MKKAGLIILVIGLLLTAYTGFNFITKEKVVDIGKVEITRDKDHDVTWSPIVGIAVIIVGGAMYLIGAKK
jgi:hypothetical protein